VNRRVFIGVGIGAVLSVAAGGCGQHSVDPGELPARLATSPLPAEVVHEAEVAATTANDIFLNRCTPCHGADGYGNGVAAASLATQPRNFHDRTWQASVDDQHIETIIQKGGPSVGKSDLMPANPDLADQPVVIAALRSKVRGFGKSEVVVQRSSDSPARPLR